MAAAFDRSAIPKLVRGVRELNDAWVSRVANIPIRVTGACDACVPHDPCVYPLAGSEPLLERGETQAHRTRLGQNLGAPTAIVDSGSVCPGLAAARRGK
jgi:hypothetical protein